MSDLVRGTVLGIDRENGTVRAEIAGVVVPEAPYLGEPPWPLSSCWFFNAPAYTCLGPIGNRRVAFADDFNFYTSGTPLIGGTGWTSGGTGTLSTPANPTDGNGVLRMTHTAVSSAVFIRKTLQMVTLAAARCYWFSARVKLDSVSNANLVTVGIADSNVMNSGVAASTDAGVLAFLSAIGGTYNQLSTYAGTSSTITQTGEAIAADTWTWVDVMAVGGQWGAMWVDGSGPWVCTTNVPDTSQDSVTPFIRGQGDVGTTKIDVDYASLALVDLATTADPATFGELDPVDDVLT